MDILPIPYETIKNSYNNKVRINKEIVKKIIKIKGIRFIKK